MSVNKKEKILIIEDNKALSSMLRGLVEHFTEFDADVAKNLDECRSLLQSNEADYAVAIADLNLPDAPDGEIIPLLSGQRLPTVVLTASYSQSLREKVCCHDIIDYVIKDSVASYEYIITLIKRVVKNRFTRVLVVDDSASQRKLLATYMKLMLFQVEEAEDGQQALDKLQEFEDIKLILTDYQMPVMDGFVFTNTVRKTYPRERFAIIGLSGHDSGNISSNFLKSGADDYLAKPLVYEELLYRVNQNMLLMDKIDEVQQMHEELLDVHNQLLYERNIVEDTLLNIRNSEDFNTDNIRYLLSPVEKTAGDIIFSAKTPEGVHNIMLGDFTGHGLPAALSGPTVADIFYSMSGKGFGGAVILEEINRKLVATLPTHIFLAACFIEYNPLTAKLKLWNSALPAALHFHQHEFVHEFASHNLALGITEGLGFGGNFRELSARAGDRFYLFTDGIIETENPAGEWYGLNRLKAHLSHMIQSGLGVDSVTEVLNAFQEEGAQADDITLIEFIVPHD